MSIIPKRNPKPLVRGYRADDTLPDSDDVVIDEALERQARGDLEEVADRYLSGGKEIALRRLNGADGGDGPGPARFEKKAWSPTYGVGIASNEPEELAALKAVYTPEINQTRDNALADMGIPGRERDRKNLMGAWFQTKLRIGSRRSENMAEDIRRDGELSKILKTSLAGDADAQGGYAVPNIVSSEVAKLIRDASQVFGIARHYPMTSDTLLIPDEATQVTTYWSTVQGSTLTQGEPVFGVKTLSAAKLFGRATLSLELVDDASIAVLPFLASTFAEKLGGDLDIQAVEGVGSPFTGIGNAASVVDAAATNGTNGVALQYGLGTTTIGGLVKIFTKGGEGLSRRDGVFISGPSVYAKVLAMVDTNGQPIVRQLGNVEGAVPNTLFGRPYIVSNRFSATTIGAGTVSVGHLYFGSPSALAFGVRQNMRFDVSEAPNWNKYQIDCRLVGRYAFVVSVAAAWTKQQGIIV